MQSTVSVDAPESLRDTVRRTSKPDSTAAAVQYAEPGQLTHRVSLGDKPLVTDQFPDSTSICAAYEEPETG